MYDMGTIRLVCPTPSETTRGTSFINYLMHFLSPFDRDWLVGLLEADGSFLCTRSPHTSKIQLAIKLTQHPSNIRALVAVKKLLRTGKIEHISSANTRICGAQRDKRSTSFRGTQAMLRTSFRGKQAMLRTCVYRIRKHHVLRTHVLPFFDTAPFMTSKYYEYLRLQKYVMNKTFFKWQNHPSRLSPRWGEVLGPNKLQTFLQTNGLKKKDAHNLLSPGWLTGFIEGDGSFYIVKKAEKRYSCGFGLTQKHGKYLLEAIRSYFGIQARVKQHASFPHVWCLDTTAKKQAQLLASYFKGRFKGKTSLRFRVWARALHVLDQPTKMQKIQAILRKLN